MAHLQLRVPSTELDTAFTRVGELGDVTAQSRAARDVTAERVDLQARVQALDTAVTRLRTLMAKAETTTDLLAAESALSARQQELDGLRAQLAYLSDQVSQATLDVTLTAQRPLPGGGPSNFWEGLNSGWNSMLAAASGAIVVLGIILPWLALAGIVVALAIWLVRRRHRRTLREEPHERVS